MVTPQNLPFFISVHLFSPYLKAFYDSAFTHKYIDIFFLHLYVFAYIQRKFRLLNAVLRIFKM